jgi:hypothetical protein
MRRSKISRSRGLKAGKLCPVPPRTRVPGLASGVSEAPRRDGAYDHHVSRVSLLTGELVREERIRGVEDLRQGHQGILDQAEAREDDAGPGDTSSRLVKRNIVKAETPAYRSVALTSTE